MPGVLMSLLFGAHAANVSAVKTDETPVRMPEAPCYGGRYYHTVTLPEGRSFADLEVSFKEIGFVPRPRHRLGDGFIGLGYSPDAETGTARILAEKKYAEALKEQGYTVSLDVPAIQPATLRL